MSGVTTSSCGRAGSSILASRACVPESRNSKPLPTLSTASRTSGGSSRAIAPPRGPIPAEHSTAIKHPTRLFIIVVPGKFRRDPRWPPFSRRSPRTRADPPMTSSYTRPVPCQWFSRLAAALDRRSAPRLALLFLGAVLARGRRTVTTWIRAAKLSDHYPVLLHRRRRRRQEGRQHRPTPADRGGPAAAQGGHAADPRPGRHPDEAVRAARPGGRRPSQPDPRPGRLALRLRPRLRRPGPARRPPGVGRRRPAAAGPALRPQEGPAGHRPEASAGSSAPSWSWPSSCCGGPSRGWGCWGCRSGWWPTGPMPRRTSSSRRWRWA